MSLMQLACVAACILVPAATAFSANVGERRVLAGEPVTYVGAVLEYEAFIEWTEGGGEAITQENARIIAEYAAEAKTQGVDILIACEGSIQGLNLIHLEPEEQFTKNQYVPDPSLQAVPCDLSGNGPNFKALRTLSCAALENQIYIVVDLAEASPCNAETAAQNPFDNAIDTAYECPSNGYIFYNTQVVFDRNGTVIARYRKRNLYLESASPGTERDEVALFVTDFGVLFSLQVCFDIAYEHPGLYNVVNHGVKDVAMSTAWVDILPFYVAPNVQNFWARHLGINLLVSGYHMPELGRLGSGIFRGFSDLKQDYVYNKESGNRMIVSELETVAAVDGVIRSKHMVNIQDAREAEGLAKDVVSTNAQPRRSQLFLYDDLSNYSHVLLPPTVSGDPQIVELCHGEELCCSLTYELTSSLNYSFLAYSGITYVGNGTYAMYNQVCSIVWCQTDDVNTCSHFGSDVPPNDEFGAFSISGNFTAEHIYPMGFTRNFTLIDNDLYSVTTDGHTLSAPQGSQNLMTAGLLARWYERDPPNVSTKSFYEYIYELIILFITKLWNVFQ